MDVRVVTAPTVEPITLEDAKLHLRVDHDAEDSLIEHLISAARGACEQRTNRTIALCELEATAACFAPYLFLPRPPLVSVTSVKYLPVTGPEQTLDAGTYVAALYAPRPALMLAHGASWPPVAPGQPAAVRVRYQAGYASVPSPLVQWMLLQLGHFYRNRESVAVGLVQHMPFADSLLDTYRALQF